MSQTAITLAFEQWKAQQGATGEPVLLDEFVFANVPGLNIDTPIDRNETLPPAAQIVHRQPVTRTGVVNENGVVFSAVLGADVGDFSFNWIGLLNKASGTLAMIVHAPLQQKLKTAAGQQGNVLTRSFLMEYTGAQTETGITTPAETWQIDFTARMAGMDERQRLENVDIFGTAAFFGDGYLVEKTGNQYFVTKGIGYVAGLRASLAANQNITVTTKPVKVWLDVSWTGSLTSVWGVQTKITVAADLANYEQNGVQHYVFALASIDANGNITDLRPKGTLNEQQASDALKKHEQSRNHPDATTAEKGFVQLSSATDSASEGLAATPKAVKAAYDLAKGKYTAQDATTAQKGIVQLSSATDSTSETLAATPKAVKAANDNAKAANDNANGRVPQSRKINGHQLSADTNITASDIFDGQSVYIGENQDLDTYQKPGLYFQDKSVNATAALNYPENNAGALVVLKNAGFTQIYYVYNSSRIWTRSKYSSGAWTTWAREYNTLNKPDASDVDAVSASKGGTYNGLVSFLSGLKVNKVYPSITLTDSNAANDVIGKDTILEQSGGNFYIAYRKNGGSDGQLVLSFPKVSGTIYSSGNKPTANDVGAYSTAESNNRFQLKNTMSKAVNGWFKDSSTGRIKAWGFASVGDNTVVTVNLPVTFPNECVNLQVTARSQAGNAGDQSLSAYGKIISNSQIRVSVCANWEQHGADGVYFSVEGY